MRFYWKFIIFSYLNFILIIKIKSLHWSISALYTMASFSILEATAALVWHSYWQWSVELWLAECCVRALGKRAPFQIYCLPEFSPHITATPLQTWGLYEPDTIETKILQSYGTLSKLYIFRATQIWWFRISFHWRRRASEGTFTIAGPSATRKHVNY